MIEIKNDPKESWSSNLVILKENHFLTDSVTILPQKLTLNLKNALLCINSFQNLSKSCEKK